MNVSTESQPASAAVHPGALRDDFQSFVRASDRLVHSYHSLERELSGLAQKFSSPLVGKQTTGERQLADSLDSLLSALPAGIVVLDGDGRIQQFNPTAVATLGGLTVGTLWRDTVADLVAPRWDDGHDLSLANGRRVNIATQALQNEPGQIIVIKDVTHTRQLQDQLNRRKRLSAKGEMAAALAHQIRTPLASALLYASNLQRAGVDADTKSRFSDKLMQRLQFLERIVEDMLLLARGDAIDAELMSTSQLFAYVHETISSKAANGAFRIKVTDDCAVQQLRVNRDALLSAMQNIVDNAEEASGGKGSLRITGRTLSEFIEIDFDDDGAGIDPAQAEALFDPFFSTKKTGSGLGLAVVRAVVHAHHGQVEIGESESGGTRVRIRLPLATTVDAVCSAAGQ